MTSRRRRRVGSHVSIGSGESFGVWLEPSGRRGLHFRLDDPSTPFVITGRWDLQQQGLVLAEIAITSRRHLPQRGLDALIHPQEVPPTHLTGSVIRSVSVPELERRTRDALRHGAATEAQIEEATEALKEAGLALPASYAVPRASRRFLETLGEASFRRGRKGYPVGLYEMVATEYLRALQKGTKKILPELAIVASERLGGDPVSVQNVRDWVHRARELGFLTKGHRGRAHAEPGPALRQSLR